MTKINFSQIEEFRQRIWRDIAVLDELLSEASTPYDRTDYEAVKDRLAFLSQVTTDIVNVLNALHLLKRRVETFIRASGQFDMAKETSHVFAEINEGTNIYRSSLYSVSEAMKTVRELYLEMRSELNKVESDR